MWNVVRLPIKDIPIANVKKPVLNLFDKEKYVIHYKN